MLYFFKYLREKEINYDTLQVIDSNQDDQDVLQVSSARRQASLWTFSTSNPTYAIFSEYLNEMKIYYDSLQVIDSN